MPHEFGSYTFGTTPKAIILQAAKGDDFTIRAGHSDQEPIDRAFRRANRRAKLRRSTWDGEYANIVPSELYRFLKALMYGGENGESLRSGILEVLGIEEI